MNPCLWRLKSVICIAKGRLYKLHCTFKRNKIILASIETQANILNERGTLWFPLSSSPKIGKMPPSFDKHKRHISLILYGTSLSTSFMFNIFWGLITITTGYIAITMHQSTDACPFLTVSMWSWLSYHEVIAVRLRRRENNTKF